MAQPKEKDPISLELHDAMIKATGASIARLKNRLKETNMTFQLKPPEDEKMEVWKWEKKIRELVDYKEKYDFPTEMEMKRARAKRQQGIAESNAEKDRIDADRKAMHAALAKEANRKLNLLREGKIFGKANTFGGPGVGEAISTIENYDGLNCVYKGERTLVRKDGRFTKQDAASEIPPWIGPQYYSNLDPPFLATGLFPANISQIPFKSATNGRNISGRSANELRDAKIIRREKLESWKQTESGPGYLTTPVRLSPERLLRHHGYVKDSNNNFVKETDTLASTVITTVSDPRVALDRRPPVIVLGNLTRQFILVEKESAMMSRCPPSKRAQFESNGPSALKIKANAMLAEATSYAALSNTLSAKLARHEQAVKVALDSGIVNGRIDYTKGALVDIDNAGAPAEQTQGAPSITGSDNASVGTSLLSSKQLFDDNPGETQALATTSIAFASPLKKLIIVSKDVISGDDINKAEKSEEDRAREETRAENLRVERVEDGKKKLYYEKRARIREEFAKLTPIEKSFSKRKLPLISPIKPQIQKWLHNPDVIYHRSKEPEWLGPALERQREEMLAVPGIERKKNPVGHDNIDVLLMEEENRNEVRAREGLKDERAVNDMYESIFREHAKSKPVKESTIPIDSFHGDDSQYSFDEDPCL
jgi:hypothetical protein